MKLPIMNLYNEETGKFEPIDAIKGANGRTPIKGVDYRDGEDGAKIVECASEEEAIQKSKGDTKNFYVWV